ncbi:hypothetical protein [Nocardia rhamnosiphila]|uniref:Uncharacterized protein n=1 Tax=Nocardia rhamnosiphila TaxID=426716 RepID=A0ABV2WXN5_9NOCA
MHDWPLPDSAEVPTPELVAAWVALEIIPSERIPFWAAHWLAQGYDGETLRILAGLSGTDSREVEDLLLEALADCTAVIPDSNVAAAQLVFTVLAHMYVDNRITERKPIPPYEPPLGAEPESREKAAETWRSWLEERDSDGGSEPAITDPVLREP